MQPMNKTIASSLFPTQIIITKKQQKRCYGAHETLQQSCLVFFLSPLLLRKDYRAPGTHLLSLPHTKTRADAQFPPGMEAVPPLQVEQIGEK